MDGWQNSLIEEFSSIADAIQLIDTSEFNFALVVNGDGQFIGVLSDSTLRKAALRGLSSLDTVGTAMRACSQSVAQENNNSNHPVAIESRRVQEGIVVSLDSVGKPTGIEFLENKNWSVANTPVVLMVGGVGNRLRPLTDQCPKPLLKVGNKPILQRTLESLIRQGFKDFFFSVNYKAELIEAFFKDGSQWGVEIKYLREHQRMGTAGSLRLLPSGIREPIIVMNGDLFSESDLPIAKLLRFHKTHGAKATMAVAPHQLEIPFGVVKTDGELLTNIEEKPTHISYINAGMYVIEPEYLNLIPEQGLYDMPSLFERLIQQGSKTCAFSLREEWIDIGSFETFEKVCKRFGGTPNGSLGQQSNFAISPDVWPSVRIR